MRALLAVLMIGCGVAPASVARVEASDEVRVEESATLDELLRSLATALLARGYEGECFLAWEAEGEPRVTVRVGERARSARVSCGGLDGIAAAVEGRCIAARWIWIDEARHTRGLTFYFAPPGVAYATTPARVGPTSVSAAEVVFLEVPAEVRHVLGVPLARERGGAKKQVDDEESVEDPFDDPEMRQAVEQLVGRVNRCNPDGSGSLVVRWQVHADGRIEGVQRLSGTVDDEVSRCVLELVSAASFPEHEASEPLELCAPLMLDPSLR